MKSKYLLINILALFFLVIIHSCIDQDYSFDKLSDETIWEPSLATTIGTKTIVLEEYIKDLDSITTPQIDADKFITIIYRQDMPTQKANNIIKLQNQETTYPLSKPLNDEKFVQIDTSYSFNTIFQYSKDEKITSVLIDSMTINASLTSSLDKNESVEISFPDIKKDGVILSVQKISSLSDGSIEKTVTAPTTSAKGYTISLLDTTIGDKPSSYFRTQIKYSLKNPTGITSNKKNGATGSHIDIILSDLVYKQISGYVGKYDLLNDSVEFNTAFMNNPITKGIEWKNPTISLNFDNSYGVPLQFTFLKLIGQNDNAKYSVFFKDISEKEYTKTSYQSLLKYPLKTEIGMSKIDAVKLDTTTSNIRLLLNNNIKSLKAYINVKANPAGLTNDNFVLDTSKIKTSLEVALPLHFKASSLGKTDTMDFDIKEYLGENNSIGKLMLRFHTENEFPVDVKLKIYFADENFHIIDSLSSASGKLLVAGTIQSNQRTLASKANIDFIFDGEKAVYFSNTKKAIIKYEIQTANIGFVKFYADYKITLKASFFVKAKIKI